jgi:hypothetical protein
VTSLAADVFLLMIDDRTGEPVRPWGDFVAVLAGAVLSELEMAGRITTDQAGPGFDVDRLRVRVTNTEPTGDDVLDRALARLARSLWAPCAPQAVNKLISVTFRPLLRQLSAAGFLRTERILRLGVFPATRWKPLRPEYSSGLLDELRAAMVAEKPPVPRINALIGLLASVQMVEPLLGQNFYRDNRDAWTRAAHLVRGPWPAAVISHLAGQDAALSASGG